jgi:hypothetical protein
VTWQKGSIFYKLAFRRVSLYYAASVFK